LNTSEIFNPSMVYLKNFQVGGNVPSSTGPNGLYGLFSPRMGTNPHEEINDSCAFVVHFNK
ncbi:MAG: hypothetical protein AAF212_08740, partial [Verrucomicrobiota bacterium]